MCQQKQKASLIFLSQKVSKSRLCRRILPSNLPADVISSNEVYLRLSVAIMFADAPAWYKRQTKNMNIIKPTAITFSGSETTACIQNNINAKVIQLEIFNDAK